MSPSDSSFTFVLPPDLKAALRAIKDRDGIPEAEQIRRGIRLWLEQKGEPIGPAPKRGAKRVK